MKYLTIIIFSILFSTVLGGKPISESFGSRIVNGKDAPKGAFPYFASIRGFTGIHYCSGAILNDRWILTSSYCTLGPSNEPLSVQVGSNTPEGGVLIPIISKSSGPGASGYPLYHNDIALFKVEYSIKFNNVTQPISLAFSNVEDNKKAVVMGFGNTNSERTSIEYLNVTLWTRQTCQKKVTNDLHESVICAYGPGEHTTGYGDTGAPLVADGVVVGVKGLRNNDKPSPDEYLDFYTDVYQFVDWIRETIKN